MKHTVTACRQAIVDAKEKEPDNLIGFGMFIKAEDKGHDSNSSKWRLTKKDHTGEKIKIKIKVVDRGFQEYTNIQSDTPTVYYQ